jgi:hypothetical protein
MPGGEMKWCCLGGVTMDPMTAILSALAVAGARVGGDAIQDAYAGLKSLLIRKFGQADPRLESRIDDYVSDKDTYFRPAEKALREVSAQTDEEVIGKAKEVLSKASQAEPAATAALVGQVNAQNAVIAQQIFGGVNQTSGGGGRP